jgi:hypothetical protein
MKAVRKPKAKKREKSVLKRVLRVSMDDMPVMTSKIKAAVGASVGGLFGFVSWARHGAAGDAERHSRITGRIAAA